MIFPAKNIFIGCDKSYETAKTVIFGAPFDGTTSYRPGTRFAPFDIRAESYGIETYSPYCDRDLADFDICDTGDLEFPFGNTARVLDMIDGLADEILKDGKKPVMLGGEHLVTLGAVRALSRIYGDLAIVHLDAHADLRDNYIEEKFSHATVIRRCYDLLGENSIFQFGIRSGDRSEFEFAEHRTFMEKFTVSKTNQLKSLVNTRPVYVTLDLDVLDPSEFPGTGTPEAGGISFTSLIWALREIFALNVVGADICELSPPYDKSGISTALACKVLREVLLLI